jgi:hypothetical protein
LRRRAWLWLIALAFACGVAIVVLALTVHDRCSSSDPACVFHSYTLVHTAGPAALAFVGAPAVISGVVALLLRMKVTRRNVRVGEAAWILGGLSCLICLVGLAVEGFLMFLAGVLTLAAVAVAPLPRDPSHQFARVGQGQSPGSRPSSTENSGVSRAEIS